MATGVIVNPAPEIVADVTVNAALPVFFRVTVCEPVEPIVTLPSATGEGVTVNCGPVVPVPERVMESAVSPPSPIEIVPLAAPLTVGANFTANCVLFPALNVKGVDNPVIENPLPVMEACVSFKSVEPVFSNVTFWELLELTVTFPKLIVPGVAARLLELVVVAPKPQPEITATAASSIANTRKGNRLKVFVLEKLEATEAE